jgi:MarR family transcriptional regulator, organic hydroperoxide resistance regulator
LSKSKKALPQPDVTKVDVDRVEISDRVTILLHRIIVPAVEITNAEISKFGINISGARVLDALLAMGEMRVGRLCELTAIDNSTLSHLLKRMETLGYIERNRIVNDNRSVMVSLTPKGQEIAAFVSSLSNESEKALLAGFTADEADMLRTNLKKLLANSQNRFT